VNLCATARHLQPRFVELFQEPSSKGSGIVTSYHRREFFKQVGGAALAGMLVEAPGAFAEQLTLTPEQTEGPYYPTSLPLDTDNDLVVINDALTSAVGQITYVSGRVLTPSGDPVRNAYVEIWHADNSGAYIHPMSIGYSTRDRNFQGFGRFLTGSTGEYLFRTIKPGLYTGRARHIHFKVKVSGRPELTSQLYFLGEPQNNGDSVLSGIRDSAARNSVIVPFVTVEGSTVGALAGRFDIVFNTTVTAVPAATLTNTTDPSRNPVFRAGDSWRLDIRNASAGAAVYLRLWKDNVDFGVSGPYGTVTDGTGAWSLSGSFGSGDVGSWQLQVVVGGAASRETSGPVALRITAS
jgi:protocatechuate 3,4-dioxygenase beta subunit